MLKLITKYGLAAHLAFLGVAPLFLSATAVFWLAALGLVWLFMEPSRIGREMLHDARHRITRGLVRDPFFWVVLVLLVISGVRGFNTITDEMMYDAELGTWSLATSPLPLLPGSSDNVGLSAFSTVCAAFVVVLGARHALGKKARFAFLMLSSFFASMNFFVNIIAGTLSKSEILSHFSAHPEDPYFIGVIYGLFLWFALVSFAAASENRWWGVLPIAAIALCGNFTAFMLFSSPSAILIMGIGGVLILAYAFLYLRIRLGKTSDFRFIAICAIAFALAVMIAISLVGGDKLEERKGEVTFSSLSSELRDDSRAAISAISCRVWKDSPWLGRGLGMFRQTLEFSASSADWRKIRHPNQTAPRNGYWLLLVERGVIGVSMVVLPILMLLFTYFRRLVAAGIAIPHPVCIVAPLVVAAAGLEMLIDCSFVLQPMLVPFLVILSISSSSFSKRSVNNG